MSAATASDDIIRRLERRAALVALLSAAAAYLITRGDQRVALGVAGGWMLVELSLWSTRSSIDGLIALAERAADAPDRAARRRRGLRLLARFGLRYALLGLAGYVMIARLRLHPLGLIVGVSSVVAAVAFEAARIVRSPTT